ncbi:MAG UNVERIFIED_CONTAM: tetratricopeptide repeat protein [Planctomycetaceae bacterium]|jgi:putative thioredoxin
MPLLEKLAHEFKGAFCLVKVNVDQLPEIAGAFGVQSIPFVVAMVQGQPAAHFAGIKTEPQLREWLQQLLPSPAEEAWNEGQQHESEGRLAEAEQCYRKASSLEPDAAQIRIAQRSDSAGAQPRSGSARGHRGARKRGFLEPEAQLLKSQLEIRGQVEDSGGVAEARTALQANPGDLTLKLQLAEAYGADNRFEEAFELLLEIIRTDRGGVGTQAKEVMVQLLTVMGPKSKLAGEYRRKLATAFY